MSGDSEDCWEARMAARARARWIPWAQQYDYELAAQWAEHQRRGVAAQQDMTLGYATDLHRVEPWACACVGGTNCCRFQWMQAELLTRAAHIVVKQIAELADEKATAI